VPTAADDIALLVAQQGRPLVLRVVLTPAVYNPGTGTTAPAVTRDDELTGMLLAGGTFVEKGTLVQGAAPRAVFAARDVPTVPDQGAKIIDGTTVYDVVRVRTRSLDGAPVVVVCEMAA
jgi:hypothetical protein